MCYQIVWQPAVRHYQPAQQHAVAPAPSFRHLCRDWIARWAGAEKELTFECRDSADHAAYKHLFDFIHSMGKAVPEGAALQPAAAVAFSGRKGRRQCVFLVICADQFDTSCPGFMQL